MRRRGISRRPVRGRIKRRRGRAGRKLRRSSGRAAPMKIGFRVS